MPKARKLDPALRRFFPEMPADIEAIADDVARIESRDVTAMRRVLERTGKLVGPFDVRSAAGSIGALALTEGLFDHDVSALDDTAIASMLDAVRNVTLSESETHRAIDLLIDALDQPALPDLIFYSREELETARLIEIARTCRGPALEPFIDPQCHPIVEEARGGRTTPASLRRAREVLLAMVEAEELELSMGEHAAALLAALITSKPSADSSTFATWLEGRKNGIAEVFADDDALARRWSQLLAS